MRNGFKRAWSNYTQSNACAFFKEGEIMKRTKWFRPSAVCTAVAMTLALGGQVAFAQDSEDELIEQLVSIFLGGLLINEDNEQ